MYFIDDVNCWFILNPAQHNNRTKNETEDKWSIHITDTRDNITITDASTSGIIEHTHTPLALIIMLIVQITVIVTVAVRLLLLLLEWCAV